MQSQKLNADEVMKSLLAIAKKARKLSLVYRAFNSCFSKILENGEGSDDVETRLRGVLLWSKTFLTVKELRELIAKLPDKEAMEKDLFGQLSPDTLTNVKELLDEVMWFSKTCEEITATLPMRALTMGHIVLDMAKKAFDTPVSIKEK